MWLVGDQRVTKLLLVEQRVSKKRICGSPLVLVISEGGTDKLFWIHVGQAIIFTVLSVWAFARLATASRQDTVMRSGTSDSTRRLLLNSRASPCRSFKR